MHVKALVVLPALISLLTALPLLAQDAVNQPDRAVIEKIVREYILQHPEVIAQAANLYQEHERAAQKVRVKEAVAAKLADLEQDQSSPAAGAARGVTIVEFFDYHCVYCRRTEPTIENLLRDRPDIKFVFKEFPVLGAESLMAAKASLAADKQGGYLKFHQALMTWPGPITTNTIEQLAMKQGLNVAQLKFDMESPEVQSILARNSELGRQVGVTGTPAFVIGSELVQGAMDAAAFEKLIAQAKPVTAQAAGSAVQRNGRLQ
ncbi:MAG: DsbA family protein [Acidobacteriota bacterium]|nr:DsbA family protein [Acidobacteriota bacterium]